MSSENSDTTSQDGRGCDKVKRWLSTSKRKMHHSPANADGAESGSAMEKFREPTIKWTRIENNANEGPKTRNRGKFYNPGKIHSMKTRQMSRMQGKSPPDVSALDAELHSSQGKLELRSPAPDTALSPTAWERIVESTPQIDETEIHGMTSFPEPTMTLSNKPGQKDPSLVRRTSATKDPSTTTPSLFSGQSTSHPEFSTTYDELPSSSQMNGEVRPLPTASLPIPASIPGSNIGQKESSFRKEMAETSSSRPHVPPPGSLPSHPDPPTTSQELPSCSSQQNEETEGAQSSAITVGNVGRKDSSVGKEMAESSAASIPLSGSLAQGPQPPTTSQDLSSSSQRNEEEVGSPSQTATQAASIPKPAATVEEFSSTFENLDEGTVSWMADHCKAEKLRGTVTNIMKLMMEKKLAKQFTWTGVSSKKNCPKLKFEDSPAHKFLKKILEKTPFANKSQSRVRKAVVRTLHNVPDWGNGRVSRRKKDDPGEGTSTPKIGKRDDFGPNHDDIVIHGRAEMLMRRTKFEEAISLLEDHPTTLMQQMKLFECYFQLGREEKVAEVIENMRTLVVQSPQYKAKDLYLLGRDLRESSPIKAITYFICAAKIYPRVSNPNEVVKGISLCSLRCREAISEIVKQNERMHDFAWGVGLKITNDMLNEVADVTNADPDVKTVNVAWCLCNTGGCYYNLKNYDKAKELLQRGIDIMTHQFGSDSSKYSVYGYLLGAWVKLMINWEIILRP